MAGSILAESVADCGRVSYVLVKASEMRASDRRRDTRDFCGDVTD